MFESEDDEASLSKRLDPRRRRLDGVSHLTVRRDGCCSVELVPVRYAEDRWCVTRRKLTIAAVTASGNSVYQDWGIPIHR